MSNATAKRIAAGYYKYRGYRILWQCDENDVHTGKWNVAEKVAHSDWNGGPDWSEWVVFDTFATLEYCKKRIDYWIDEYVKGE